MLPSAHVRKVAGSLRFYASRHPHIAGSNMPPGWLNPEQEFLSVYASIYAEATGRDLKAERAAHRKERGLAHGRAKGGSKQTLVALATGEAVRLHWLRLTGADHSKAGKIVRALKAEGVKVTAKTVRSHIRSLRVNRLIE
jgi:hypothetical protein